MDNVEYALGDIVYHVVCDEAERGMVTGIMFRPSGVCYYVTWADGIERQFYAIELSTERVVTF